tara:strand:+ start:1640 stop:2350 length:711 start_codon:yes stop_codon:yes gene_type:complete
MNNERMKFLGLFADRVEMRIELDWADTIGPNETIAPEKARQLVANVLRQQLVDTQLKSSDSGMKAFYGLMALEVVFPGIAPNAREVDLVIARANEDYVAFQALRMLVVLGYPKSFVALQAWDRDLKADLLTEPPAPKGPSVLRDAQRNMIIISQIKQLERLRFKPMRSEKKNKSPISGCDIVSGAMADIDRAMSYSTVETIWKNRDKIPQPKTLANMLIQGLVGSLEGDNEKSSGK